MNDFLLVPDREKIVQSLLHWFRKTKRDLPWRRTYNPYHVWISEIMLQQTQMERGVSYFLRWIERFPNVYDLAEAQEQEILKYWQGLGYYARARNLHRAAKVLVDDFDGEIPCDYLKLLSLPGIGPYTAAAIASVACNKDVAVVDANVTRVYARMFDIGEPVKSSRVKKQIQKISDTFLPLGRARVYNQSLMDLGGLICTPKSPRCNDCPVGKMCRALKHGTVAQRPVVERPRKTVAIHKVAGLICWEGRFFIQQRRADQVWGGLWEFPGGELAEENAAEVVAGKIYEETGLRVVVGKHLTTVNHQYTHHKITLDSFLCYLSGNTSKKNKPVLKSACDYRWAGPAEIADFGFPAGPRKILEYLRENEPEILA